MNCKHFYPPTLIALILILVTAGCASSVSGPLSTSTPVTSPTAILSETSSPVTPEQMVNTLVPTAIPTSEAKATKGLLYEDDFSPPSGDWPKEEVDNYYTGYHEPDYYHVENQSPYFKKLVFIPGKQNYRDTTVEVKVFTLVSRTDLEGDYRYGLVFRRLGDQYYAFTISPTTQKWYMLKGTPDRLVTLKEGTDESIGGLDLETEDTLRVDIKGPIFFLHINDRLVDQITDPEYTEGEVGFYVETTTSSQAHAHFDAIVVQEFQPYCIFPRTALYLRSGPDLSYSTITALSQRDEMEPLGISPDGVWIRVRVQSGNQVGWVYADWVSCNLPLDELPVVEP